MSWEDLIRAIGYLDAGQGIGSVHSCPGKSSEDIPNHPRFVSHQSDNSS